MQPRNLILIVLLLAGCQKMPTLPSITPYKMDVQQGNFVTQEMISKVKPGMTRSQVRFALGTPLVVDLFHSDRWDYVYIFQKAGEVTEHRRIVVVFQDDKLVRIEGDVVPAGSRAAAESGAKPDTSGPAAAPAKPETTAPAPASKPEVAAPPPQEGARLVTGSGEPVTSGVTTAEPADRTDKAKDEKAKEEKQQEAKPAEERGFFGRMLEKLGF